MTTGLDIIKRFEQFADPALAEDWDHVGLQLGDPSQPVHKLLTTLDVRPEVVREAIDGGFDFIFSHHPLMFHAAQNLDVRDPQKKMYQDLLKHDITVYSAHTNLDTANGGMNDWLADQLQLKNIQPLVDEGTDPHSGKAVGMGRVGDLTLPLPATAFAQYCCAAFHVPALRVVNPVGQEKRLVKRVAVLGGSGSSFYQQALDKGVDAYVTGDLTYHNAQDMQARGLTVIDPGHHIEVVAAKGLKQLLEQWTIENSWTLDVEVSTVNTEPFTFVNFHRNQTGGMNNE